MFKSPTNLDVFEKHTRDIKLNTYYDHHIKGKESANKPNLVRIIDGDTLELNGIIFRLSGIDAPELNQPCMYHDVSYECGKASKEYLRLIVSGSYVVCNDVGSGGWGRRLGVCMADGKDISRLLVKSGWAFAYRKYSSEYVVDEEFARMNDLRVWLKQADMPSEWRKRQ